jgi:hypothetical protein
MPGGGDMWMYGGPRPQETLDGEGTVTSVTRGYGWATFTVRADGQDKDITFDDDEYAHGGGRVPKVGNRLRVQAWDNGSKRWWGTPGSTLAPRETLEPDEAGKRAYREGRAARHAYPNSVPAAVGTVTSVNPGSPNSLGTRCPIGASFTVRAEGQNKEITVDTYFGDPPGGGGPKVGDRVWVTVHRMNPTWSRVHVTQSVDQSTDDTSERAERIDAYRAWVRRWVWPWA